MLLFEVEINGVVHEFTELNTMYKLATDMQIILEVLAEQSRSIHDHFIMSNYFAILLKVGFSILQVVESRTQQISELGELDVSDENGRVSILECLTVSCLTILCLTRTIKKLL